MSSQTLRGRCVVRVRRLLTFAFLTLILGGCLGGDDGAQVDDPLDGTDWELTHFFEGNELRPSDATVISTAVFAKGRLVGSDGCNRYEYTYAIDSLELSLTRHAVTGAACMTEEQARQGSGYLALLSRVDAFEITGTQLQLLDGPEVVARFRPASDLPLVGISWWLASYASPTGGLISPLDGTRISIAFASGGTLVGIAGCNQYGARWSTDGSALALAEFFWTERGCVEASGIMEQEASYLEVLTRVYGFTTSLNSLRLVDSDGQVLAEFRFGGRVRDSAPTPTSTVTAPTRRSFTSEEHGIEFSYEVAPDEFVLDEFEAPEPGLVVAWSVVRRSELDRVEPNAFGPRGLTIELFQPDERPVSAEAWVRSETRSNFALGPRVLDTTTVGEVAALTYAWSGLHEARSVVLVIDERVWMFTATYHIDYEETREAFVDLLSSVRFGGELMGR